MRNILLASSALIAAVALAGTASAQSVSFDRSYLHNASGSPQVASVDVGSITVGSALTARSTAVGTSLSVDSLDNIFATGRIDQLNTSGQTSTLNVNSSTIGRDTVLSATSGGNAASFSADDTLTVSGLRQSNTAAQNATVNIGSTSISGDVAGGATAFGNSAFGESIYGGVNVSNGVQFHQSNVGQQIATTNVNGGNSFGRDTDLRSVAVGGILEFDAAGAGTYAIEQANGRGSDYYGLNGYAGSSQTAVMNVWGGSNFNGASSFGATAIGGAVNLSGTGNILAGVTTQNHNSAQIARVNISGSSFGSLAAASQAIGTSVSINTRP